jgi:hypothetical protein
MATRHHQHNEREQGGGFRNWLRNALLFGAAERVADGCSPPVAPVEPSADAEAEIGVPPPDHSAAELSAVLLPFPIRGEALLVRLAELLRGRVGNDGPRHDPFLFALSRRPQSRLTLDGQSYVEFVTSRSEFRFAIEVVPNTSISITTNDFDALVEFVVQYVGARLAEAPALEAAS